MDLSREVAIVPGGGTGIGKEIAQLRAVAGAYAAVHNARSATDALATAQERATNPVKVLPTTAYAVSQAAVIPLTPSAWPAQRVPTIRVSTASREEANTGTRTQPLRPFLHPCNGDLDGRHVPEVWPLVHLSSEKLLLPLARWASVFPLNGDTEVDDV